MNRDGGNTRACAKLTADIDLKDFCHAADDSKIEKSWELLEIVIKNTKALSMEITRPSPTFISMQTKNIRGFSVIPNKAQSRT